MKKFFQKSNRKKFDEIYAGDAKKTGLVSLNSSRRKLHRLSVEYTSIPVKVKEVRDGMLMFSMLLESSIPGSVPDPQIVSGILELVSLSLSHTGPLYAIRNICHLLIGNSKPRKLC